MRRVPSIATDPAPACDRDSRQQQSPAAGPGLHNRCEARRGGPRGASGRLVLDDRLFAIRGLAATRPFGQRRLDLLDGLGLGNALHR